MSLQILNAHTGQRLLADAARFSSHDSFKTWLEEASQVPSAQQILLTGGGKQAKFPGLRAEHEIFLYNRQLISPSSTADAPLTTIQTVVSCEVIPSWPAPSAVIDQTDLQAWQKLFGERRQWAEDVLKKSTSYHDETQEHLAAISVIERGVGVAAGNLQSHIRTLQQKLEEANDWSRELAREPETLLGRYESFRAHLNGLPAKGSLLHLLPKLQASSIKIPDGSGSLADFVNDQTAADAAKAVRASSKWVGESIATAGTKVGSVAASSEELMDSINKTQMESIDVSSQNIAQLLEEVAVIAKKFDSDHEHAASLSQTAKSVSQVSKTGALHLRTYIQSISDVYNEMVEHLQAAVKQRNETATSAIQNMQRIATVEMEFARANAQLSNVDLPKSGADALDILHLISQLPLVYGSLAIEAVRRREWSDKLKNESAALAEDIAEYRDEEEKRRRKWLKNFGHSITAAATGATVLKFELNLQSEGQEWPEVTRNDISKYLTSLQRVPPLEDFFLQLSEAVQDLDRPSRRQIKQVKAFKNGSAHEAADRSKGSFLLRGQDEIKALRDINFRLQEDLKGQKSRVRKLEDLVFKQGQPPRTTSGNLFQSEAPRSNSPTSVIELLPSASSPKQDVLARKASINTRRASGAADDKNLARRIVTLEAELHEERQKRADAETLAETNKAAVTSAKAQLQEVRSTNTDLMANMDNQQREFAEECKILTGDVDRYKNRVEDLEDELDRVIGSREDSRAVEEERTITLESRLEQLTAEQQANMAVHTEAQEELTSKAYGIHAKLSGTDNEPPQATLELFEAIDALVDSALLHQQELKTALNAVQADKAALQSSLDKHEKEFSSLRRALRESQETASCSGTGLQAERAKSVSLTADLEDARSQLRMLRAKFAEGETGSDLLRQRLDEQADRASTLASALAQSKSQISSLDVELSNMQRKNLSLETDLSQTSRRLEHRSVRDRNLTHRVVEYVEELTSLLESLGLSILERDGIVSIQRTSKLAGAASTTLTEPGSTSPSAPLGQPFDVSIDPALSNWMQSATEEEEKRQYLELTRRLDAFSLTKFSEAVVKLRRDVEWTGKKWKAEARSYRDKFQKAQTQAHDKIAYRSFKDGDLALFLPTRNQATRPWAAFNVGAPHYFLREQDSHKLQHREWLVARISKVEERVVDLSKPPDAGKGTDNRSIGDNESGISFDDDNPFELSDGLRWYLLDAAEEKSGAPSTPGLGKSTLASVQRVDAKGSIPITKSRSAHDASAKLNKSLDSRRSSTSSKRGSISSGISGRALVLDHVVTTAATPASFVPVSAAVDGLQKVASMTNLAQARPTSARSATAIHIPAAAHPQSGLGIEVARAADEHAVAHSPLRPQLGVFDAASPPRPSWLARSASERLVSKTAAPTGAVTDHGDRNGVLLSTRPSPSKAKKHTSPSKAPQMVRSSSASPTKPRQAAEGAWKPLWTLDMSIEENTQKK